MLGTWAFQARRAANGPRKKRPQLRDPDAGMAAVSFGRIGLVGAALDLRFDLRDRPNGGAVPRVTCIARDTVSGALVGAQLKISHAGQALGQRRCLANSGNRSVVIRGRRRAFALGCARRSAQLRLPCCSRA